MYPAVHGTRTGRQKRRDRNEKKESMCRGSVVTIIVNSGVVVLQRVKGQGIGCALVTTGNQLRYR